jgi:putative transposase
VSPEFISSVTDAVMAEVTAWQSRPLEPMYPVVFFDALRVKIREDAVVRNKAIYLALGVLPDGTRDILGLWIENTEGAKFWMKVFNDLKTRGVADILIAVTDGLKGMAEALEAVFPATTLADLHRASDPQQSGLRELEGPQGAGGGDQADLHRTDR